MTKCRSCGLVVTHVCGTCNSHVCDEYDIEICGGCGEPRCDVCLAGGGAESCGVCDC